MSIFVDSLCLHFTNKVAAAHEVKVEQLHVGRVGIWIDCCEEVEDLLVGLHSQFLYITMHVDFLEHYGVLVQRLECILAES